MQDKTEFYVISHTHWDREWYMPLEKFRLRLVDLMDNLFEILEQFPQYIFHLDAQTIILEDYLAIRPYKKQLLQRYIEEGRILVGPWYVQNDFYLASGEATIRNLLIGSEIAKTFGKCTWVGYTPDQFGLISQLPQIFNGFGISECIFGRGYNFFEEIDGKLQPLKVNAEFFWDGKDGSRVLAINMPFWYNNAQRFPDDIEKSMKYLRVIENNFEGITLTPYLLLMNGVDHLEAQENLLPILRKINKKLPENKHIKQATMSEYVYQIKEYIKESGIENQMSEYVGELRNGTDHQILQGTLSSRIYLKIANVIAQNLIEACIEPMYSFIEMSGIKGQYPIDYINYLWKLLIQNHAHDSICGCSRDEVHRHMEDRFERINEGADEILRRGMDFISARIDRKGLTDRDYIITIFNTMEMTRDGVFQLDLQFPVEENVKNFKIYDIDGDEVPFIVLSKAIESRGIFSPINLPGTIEVDSYKIQAYVENIKGLGYRTLVVRPCDSKIGICGMQEEGYQRISNVIYMENEYIKVTISNKGRIDILYKESGRIVQDFLTVEDTGDIGDAYVYVPSSDREVFTTHELTPEITYICDTQFEKITRLVYDMHLPEKVDPNSGKRSERLLSNKVVIELILKKGSRFLEVSFYINNVSKDHRLRALIATDIDSDYSHASTPFDAVKRDRRDVLKGIRNGTQPNSGFVNVDGKHEGLAVLNKGLFEYEHLLDDRGTIAITLLRSNEWISRQVDTDCIADKTWLVPENQCIGEFKLDMAIYPHTGNYIDANVANIARQFLNPLLSYFQPVDINKFLGGRPAVQDSEINEIFYREDTLANVVFPRERHFIEIKGKGIVLSALKKSCKDDSLIIRIYNICDEETEFGLSYFKPISWVYRANFKEEKVTEVLFEGNNIEPLKLKPKEIFTLALK